MIGENKSKKNAIFQEIPKVIQVYCFSSHISFNYTCICVEFHHQHVFQILADNVLTFSILGLIFSRQNFDFLFIFFPDCRV